MTTIETTRLGSLEPHRMLTGLWQVADLERTGPLDIPRAAEQLAAYAADGFATFDMADHYGSAELIAGRVANAVTPRPLAFTKWCPAPGPMTGETVRAGLEERRRRLGTERVDLLQLHWWTFEHPAWLDALHELAGLREAGLIAELGVTNFDAAHLHLAVADGIPLVSNQVSFSLIDRRAAGPLASVCERTGVRLLAYGTLAGGFLSERWLGKPRPDDVPDWSGMKYLRFIDAAGGWDAFQTLLGAAARVAERHGVSVANVATRWVLEQPHVAGVIVGARLGEREHRADNARVFTFSLDEADHETLQAGFAALGPIPGDCGDEYRRPPFLTASGDLSHHLSELPAAFTPETVPARPDRQRVGSGSVWEDLAGYCRAMRVGDRIVTAGTTATHGADRVVAPGDAAAQTTYILDKIFGAIRSLGGTPEDVIRTRVYLSDIRAWEGAARAHGQAFSSIKPANTLLAVGALVGDYVVEIEAEAELPRP